MTKTIGKKLSEFAHKICTNQKIGAKSIIYEVSIGTNCLQVTSKKYATGYLVSKYIFSYLHPQENWNKNLPGSTVRKNLTSNILKMEIISENKWPVQLKRTEDRGPSNKLPKNIDERIRKQFLLRHESAIRSCKNLPLKTTQAGLGHSWVKLFSLLDKQICSFNLCLYFGRSWGQLLK